MPVLAACLGYYYFTVVVLITIVAVVMCSCHWQPEVCGILTTSRCEAFPMQPYRMQGCSCITATAIWPVSGSLLGDGGSYSGNRAHECNNNVSFEANSPAAALSADSADSLAEWQDDLAKEKRVIRRSRCTHKEECANRKGSLYGMLHCNGGTDQGCSNDISLT